MTRGKDACIIYCVNETRVTAESMILIPKHRKPRKPRGVHKHYKRKAVACTVTSPKEPIMRRSESVSSSVSSMSGESVTLSVSSPNK